MKENGKKSYALQYEIITFFHWGKQQKKKLNKNEGKIT